VPCSVIFRIKAGIDVEDDTDLTWFNELADNDELADRQLVTARNYLQMEALMRALDSMETVGASVDLQLE
jgi:nuclear pore complex protein Nup107